MALIHTHSTSTRPVTTAHLAQTMALLSLTVEQLKQQIDSELSSNPALELVEERRCPSCKRIMPDRGICPYCSCQQSISVEEPIVFISPRDEFIPQSDVAGEDYPDEPFTAESEDLPTYVMRQIAPDLKPDQQKIAAFLLTNLDEDGLLRDPADTLIEIAQYCHTTISKVIEVQKMIQRAEPLGVGSNSPQDALLVQINVLAETLLVPEFAEEIVRDCLDALSHRAFSEIAHRFGISLKQVKLIAHFVSENLNPYPARSHWGDVRNPTSSGSQVYHQPDVIICFLNEDPQNPLVVEIIMPLFGTLRINPLYRQAIREATQDSQYDLRSDYERATLFVKCLQQRNHTMTRLMQRVVSLQRDFIIRGERYMRSVTRATIAQELGVHESTVSRAVANKTVQLPNRKIIPLADFFDRSLNARTALQEIINQETSPLTDAELVFLMAQQGFRLARRTVAKYRAIENILPAHQRRSAEKSL